MDITRFKLLGHLSLNLTHPEMGMCKSQTTRSPRSRAEED